MFKKVGKYLLSAALVFTSVFAIAGCGKDDDSSGKTDPTVISKEDWKNGINYDSFKVKTSVDVTPEDDMVGSHEINFHKEHYELNHANIFYPDSEGGGSVPNSNYIHWSSDNIDKATYRYNTDTMSWYWDVEDCSKDEYDTNISDIRSLVWKLKVNQSLFTKDEGDSTYRMNVSGSIMESYVTTMKEVLGVNSFNIETIVVFRNTDNEYIITFNSSTETIITMSFHDVGAVDYYFEEVLLQGGPINYTLVNNSNDVNQITIEVNADGFHVVAQSGEEYFKDNGDGTYTQYLKNGESFTSHNYNSDSAYLAEYKAYVTVHTFDWDSLSLGNFKVVDGKYIYNGNVDVTNTGTRYEYYFSNIVINTGAGGGRLETITWDYKVHDKATNQDSPVYQIVVTPRTTITYPTVG